MELILFLLQDALLAAIPAVGFAMVFHVPPKLLVYCAMGGAFAHSFRALLIHFGITIEWSSFVAAASMGFLGVYWSQKLLVPRPVFTVASVIPMIPGSFAFTTIIGIVEIHNHGFSQELMKIVMENGLKTIFILVALSFGLALPSVLIYRSRPVV